MHMTFTGFYSGKTLCGSSRDGDAVHAMFSPVDNPEFRAKVCPDCLKVYAESYIDDDGKLENDAPQWVFDLLTHQDYIPSQQH